MLRLPGRWNNPALHAYHLLWTALDWLYPPSCAGCGREGMRWCNDCRQSVVKLSTWVLCPVCGDPSTGVCQNCSQNHPPFCGLRSWSLYQGALREAIHALKYQKDIAMGESLAEHLIEVFTETGWSVDLVTAVPLGRARLTERGYNQSALLARPLALHLRRPFASQILERIRETQTQVGLSARERHDNMAGAFRARNQQVAGKHILVIDDVTTTGATIHACAQALTDAGAAAVYGLTLARAVRQADLSKAAGQD